MYIINELTAIQNIARKMKLWFTFTQNFLTYREFFVFSHWFIIAPLRQLYNIDHNFIEFATEDKKENDFVQWGKQSRLLNLAVWFHTPCSLHYSMLKSLVKKHSICHTTCHKIVQLFWRKYPREINDQVRIAESRWRQQHTSGVASVVTSVPLHWIVLTSK